MAEMRTLWTRDTSVREWLVCGEFVAPEGGSGDVDFLKDRGGEAALRPAVGLTHRRPDGSTVTWQQFSSPRPVLDFRRVLPGRSSRNATAYAAATITRANAGPTVLAICPGLGAAARLRVWVNGQPVYDGAPDAWRLDPSAPELVTAPLLAGANRLLVRVDTRGEEYGAWGVQVQVLEADEARALDQRLFEPSLATRKNGDLTVLTDRKGPRLSAPAPVVAVRVVAPGGRATAPRTAPRGERVVFATSPWPEGPYEVVCTLAQSDGSDEIRYLPWFKGDARRAAADLVAGAANAETDTRAGLIHRMLADMAVEKLGGDPAQAPAEALPHIYRVLVEFAELQQEGSGGPGGARPHGLFRLAYRDEVDGSPQFARAYLPAGYTPEKPWPLVINLHGFRPSNPSYVQTEGSDGRHDALADRHGAIVLYPHGRGNTRYRGIGEQDVLRCLEEAKAHLSVDADRVYLTGYSMGGFGVWHVGTRRPHLFAALAPYFGGWDYRVGAEEEALAKLSALERFSREQESGFAQAEQLLNLPIWVTHGDEDNVVRVAQSRYAVQMLQRWGYPVRYQEVPHRGHEGLGTEGALYPWLLAQRRQTHPRQVRLRAADLKGASAYWLAVTQREDPFAFIAAQAQVVAPNALQLDTENALEVTLTLGPPLVDPEQPVHVLWNGVVHEVALEAEGRAVLRAEGYAPTGLVKTPAIEGRLSDFTTTPFAIVIGTTAPDELTRRLCRQQAETIVRQWEGWQHWKPRVVDDTELGDADLQAYSLLLIGGPEANAVTQKLAAKLPVAISPEGFTLDGTLFAAREAALSVVYPHPLNPARYVMLIAGNTPGGLYFARPSPDYLDFVIFDGRVPDPDEGRPAERVRPALGSFDHAWRLDPAYVVTGDPALRGKCRTRRVPRQLSAAVDGRRLLLSDLLETWSSGSFTEAMRGQNWRGEPLTLGGKTYLDGLAAHVGGSQNAIEYDLREANWTRLRAVIGLEVNLSEPSAAVRDSVHVTFIVRGDGKELFRSEPFAWSTAPRYLDVDVTGVETLRLELLADPVPPSALRSVDWAELRLEK